MRSVLAASPAGAKAANKVKARTTSKRRMGRLCRPKDAPPSTPLCLTGIGLYCLAFAWEEPRGSDDRAGFLRHRNRHRCRQDGRRGMARGAARGLLLEAGPSRNRSRDRLGHGAPPCGRRAGPHPARGLCPPRSARSPRGRAARGACHRHGEARAAAIRPAARGRRRRRSHGAARRPILRHRPCPRPRPATHPRRALDARHDQPYAALARGDQAARASSCRRGDQRA